MQKVFLPKKDKNLKFDNTIDKKKIAKLPIIPVR